jgi:hypothetical protein
MMLQMFNIYYFKIYRLIFYRVNDTKSEVRVRVPVDSFIRYLNGTTSTVSSKLVEKSHEKLFCEFVTL